MSDMVLTVAMAGERVAIRTATITTVIQLDSVQPVPRAPAHVAGITALRSRGLVVIDCRIALGQQAAEDNEWGGHAVVIEMDGHAYALAVDDVHDVSHIVSGPAPVPLSMPGNWKAATEGMVQLENDTVMLVDPYRVIAGPEATDTAA